MTTSVIDVTLHGSSFPATYIGDGTLIGNPLLSLDGVIAITGYFTGPGNAVSIPLGFQPTYIIVADETNVITWEWFRGQAAGHCWKSVAAGTMTIDTTSEISVSTDAAGNTTVTLGATLAASSANLSYRIEG